MNNFYYTVKPYLPREWQIYMRRIRARNKYSQINDIWPILKNSNRPPEGWNGWPDNKQFALILTHDVETVKGHDNCHKLMEHEKDMGFRSSFNFVLKKYPVSFTLRQEITNSGFEVGIHGVYHDGKLFKSKKVFLERAKIINDHLEQWNVTGFRSPAMHHNLDWIRYLNIEYDLSTFDTDPFEPQSDGVGTIFPFIVPGTETRHGYVELPYTLVQDFTLFIILKQQNISIWKKKIDWIAENGGMVLINVHPDYINFGNQINKLEEYSIQFYTQMLEYIESKYSGRYWHALPNEAAKFYKTSKAESNQQTAYNNVVMNILNKENAVKKSSQSFEPVSKLFRSNNRF